MYAPSSAPLRIFVDTSSLIAGCFSPAGASSIILKVAGFGLIDGRISPEVRIEAIRNVMKKVPASLPALQVILAEALTEGPSPTDDDIRAVAAFAHPKDVPVLACAVAHQCSYLVTLNERDFNPPDTMIRVIRPGDLVGRLRLLIQGA